MIAIKFRAWDNSTRAWAVAKVVLSSGESNPRLQGIDKDLILLPTDDTVTIEQFTGLFDKNGKEIYEGDMVRITNAPGKDSYGEDGPEVTAVAKVFFKDGAFQTNFHDALLRLALPGHWLVEVIGNVHENPELREALRWRDMAKEKPTEKDSPIVVSFGSPPHVVTYDSVSSHWRNEDGSRCMVEHVTEWRPLDLPEKGA